jgi:glycosyltransferase involved in cell wall biosynthesis
VVIEAGARGVPSVVSRVGGLPEALGKGGLAVSRYRDVAAFEAALRRVLDGWEGYSRMAFENARRFAAGDPAGVFVSLLWRRLGLEA